MSDERRIADRLRRRLKVHVGDLQLETSNVSATGLQLVCQALWLRRLKRSIEADRVALTIDVGEGPALAARGRIAYLSEAGDEYLVGVHFEHFEADGAERWQAFLT